MVPSDNPPELTTGRLLLVGAFLLVSVATTGMFVQTMTGHLAAMHAPSADVTVSDYEIVEDRTLELSLRFHNPTVGDLELGPALMNVYVDEEMVTDGTTTSFGDVTVPAGETRTVTGELGLREGTADALRNADPEQIETKGRIQVYVVDEMVYVNVEDGWR